MSQGHQPSKFRDRWAFLVTKNAIEYERKGYIVEIDIVEISAGTPVRAIIVMLMNINVFVNKSAVIVWARQSFPSP